MITDEVAHLRSNSNSSYINRKHRGHNYVVVDNVKGPLSVHWLCQVKPIPDLHQWSSWHRSTLIQNGSMLIHNGNLPKEGVVAQMGLYWLN